ncbi:MAG: hypothetical protein A2V88_13675 [Elusimicrobia bacterium RBG_16_66_12]|nr:MAG: hypothetical protein A2V88_13675 [Elusimicrobia bacterium RBG_16_66_12]
MRLAVDLSVLEQPVTGIGHVVLGLYGACAKIAPGWEFCGIHRRRLQCDLSSQWHDMRWLPWMPGPVWRAVGLRLYGYVGQPAVMHFPWNGGVLRPHPDCLTVLTLHDVIPLALADLYFSSEREQEGYRRAVQRQLNRSDVVVTDSEASKRDILRFLKPRNEPVVIRSGNSLSPGAVRGMAEPRPARYYLYYGGYEKRKDLGFLVRVFSELHRNRQVECPLVLVGQPRFDISSDFELLVTEARASGAVIVAGYVSDAELVGWLQGARALIYPSRYEGFGLPPLEAMTFGCPVITTRAGSIPEVCGDAALYFSPGHGEECAQAICRVDRDEALREELRRRGREQASKFSWDQSARTFLEVIATGLAARG